VNPVSLSIVIPVYNSSQTINTLVSEIEKAVSILPHISFFDLILVNDGSADSSLEMCKVVSEKRKWVKVIDLSKNFGQHNAILAGLRYATGDLVVCMDDDLQTQPVEIEKLFNLIIEKDYDTVFAKYSKREDSFFRRFGSRVNDRMANWLIEKPKDISISSFFIAKSFVIKEIVKYKKPYPYIAGLIFRVTRNIGSVIVEHKEREIGKSNYTLSKLIGLWLNGFTNFSIKPLRLASLTGFILSALGFIASLVIVIKKLIDPTVQVGWTSLMVGVIILGGIQLLCIGLVGEYLGRIYMSINETPQYIVKERININKSINDED